MTLFFQKVRLFGPDEPNNTVSSHFHKLHGSILTHETVITLHLYATMLNNHLQTGGKNQLSDWGVDVGARWAALIIFCWPPDILNMQQSLQMWWAELIKPWCRQATIAEYLSQSFQELDYSGHELGETGQLKNGESFT